MAGQTNDCELWEIASLIRGKNAGPFQLTLDVMFESHKAFETFIASKVLTPDLIASLYGVRRDEVQIFIYHAALAAKITIPRTVSAGHPDDDDIFGGQAHAPLVKLRIPAAPPIVVNLGSSQLDHVKLVQATCKNVERRTIMSSYIAFPFLQVSGDARERGRQHGAGASEQVGASAKTYRDLLNRLDVSPKVVADLATTFMNMIRAYDDEQAEELIGISEGSGVPLAEIVTINARTEIVAMARRGAHTPLDECTAAVVMPEASADGHLLHGQNWDGGLERVDHCIVLHIQQEGAPDILTFTEAGALLRNGFNSAGVCITGNSIGCERDYQRPGVPLPAIRRKALATPYYAKSIDAVYSTPKTGSSNMMLSHCDGEAVDIECAPDESFFLHPKDGILTHANHWESAAALSKIRVVGMSESPCSPYRGRRLWRLLNRRNGNLTMDDMRQAFLDDWQSPYSICRPPREGLFTPCTAATVLMNAAEGTMEVARVPAEDPRFTKYSINGQQPEPVEAN